MGSADCLAQHVLHFPEELDTNEVPQFLFDPVLLVKLDETPAALMLSWSLLLTLKKKSPLWFAMEFSLQPVSLAAQPIKRINQT
eukprot:387133-Pelagomonas_calceolata.AAC.1